MERMISAPGARIYCKVIGSGPPLLLLHGGPGADHTDFLPFLRPLSRTRTLILIDERGSGRSERLTDPKKYTLEAMVEDVDTVRKALGFKRVDLLGHSFGGILAQAYAIRHPRRVRHLILAGTAGSARTINAEFRRMRARLAPAVRKRLGQFERRGIFGSDGRYVPAYARLCARIYAPYTYRRKVRVTKPADYVSGWEVLRQMWVRRTDFKIEGNLRGFDFTRALRSVTAPALVVIGDHDMVSPATARKLASALPHAQLEVMRDCGHMMFVDDPAGFRSLVKSFTRKSSASGRGARRPFR